MFPHHGRPFCSHIRWEIKDKDGPMTWSELPVSAKAASEASAAPFLLHFRGFCIKVAASARPLPWI